MACSAKASGFSFLLADGFIGRDKLGFEFLDGPITPKPEKLPVAVRPKAKRRSPSRPKPKGDGKRGSVPKVPLIKV